MTPLASILVVEDEPKLAALVRDYLEDAGYACSVLGSGTGVVEWVRVHAPAAILLDVNLPGVDGLAICREVRTFSAVPILMLTARDTLDDKLKGYEAVRIARLKLLHRLSDDI